MQAKLIIDDLLNMVQRTKAQGYEIEKITIPKREHQILTASLTFQDSGKELTIFGYPFEVRSRDKKISLILKEEQCL